MTKTEQGDLSKESKAIIDGLAAVDGLISRMGTRLAQLEELASKTRSVLGQMGISSGPIGGVVVAPRSPAPVVAMAPPLDPVAEEARQEQLRYLETRKAERAALVAQNRGA